MATSPSLQPLDPCATTPLIDHGAEGDYLSTGEEPCRALGTYERFRVDLHDIGFHFNVSVVGALSVPSASKASHRGDILRAVGELVRQHPSLSVQVRVFPFAHFIRLREIDLSHVVDFRQQSEAATNGNDPIEILESLLSTENSRPFTDPHSPLWRVICLDLGDDEASRSRYVICITYHHVIADGKSGHAMLASIRDTLNGPAPESSGTPDDESTPGSKDVDFTVSMSPSQISPSMDELVPYRKSWNALFRSYLTRATPCLQKGRSDKVWAGKEHHRDGDEPPKTLIRVLQISSTHTDRLREKCKKHKTSVTAVLEVAVGTVLFRQFPEAEALRCGTALSLRRFFPPSLGIDDWKIGVWIDAFYHLYTRQELRVVDQKSDLVPWKAAEESKRRIDREVRKGLDDLSFASLQGTIDFKPELLDQLGKPRGKSYSITNIGVLEDGCPPRKGSETDTSSWRLEGVMMSQSAHVNGSAVQFGFASCVAGGMSVTMNWQEGTVREEDMDEVKGALRDEILRWAE